MQEVTKSIKELSSLISRFNIREDSSFSEVYRHNFDKLYYFANKLFHSTTLAPEDVIQDIFTTIWEKKSLRFETMDHFNNYIYLSIRNRYKDYAIKKERIDRFKNYSLKEDNFIEDVIIESEALSLIATAIDLLPQEAAKVFKMHIDGWDIKEIAEMLDKSPSTVYNQKNEAIKILKKRLPRRIFMLFI